jgi:hypothetical protein
MELRRRIETGSSSLKERIALLYRKLPSDLLSLFQFEAAGCPFASSTPIPLFPEGIENISRFSLTAQSTRMGALGIDGIRLFRVPSRRNAPLRFLFAEIDPSLADFNIHPAKRR